MNNGYVLLSGVADFSEEEFIQLLSGQYTVEDATLASRIVRAVESHKPIHIDVIIREHSGHVKCGVVCNTTVSSIDLGIYGKCVITPGEIEFMLTIFVRKETPSIVIYKAVGLP